MIVRNIFVVCVPWKELLHSKHRCKLVSGYYGAKLVTTDIKEEIESLTEEAISKEESFKSSLELVKNIEQVALTQQEELRVE